MGMMWIVVENDYGSWTAVVKKVIHDLIGADIRPKVRRHHIPHHYLLTVPSRPVARRAGIVPVGRPKPFDGCAGLLFKKCRRAFVLIEERAGRGKPRVRVRKGMIPDDMSGVCDCAHEFWMLFRLPSEKKERGRYTAPGQNLEYIRRVRRRRSVVEGEIHSVLLSTPQQLRK